MENLEYKKKLAYEFVAALADCLRLETNNVIDGHSIVPGTDDKEYDHLARSIHKIQTTWFRKE